MLWAFFNQIAQAIGYMSMCLIGFTVLMGILWLILDFLQRRK
jgi:hypothetical protein